MKKRLLVILLANAFMLTPNQASLYAQCTITQNTDDFFYGAQALTQIGQTFKACNGQVASIQFKTSLAFTNTFTVKIVDKSSCATATSAANTKGSKTVTGATIGVNTVSFSPNVILTAGTYYLEFTATSGNNTLTNFKGIDNGATYADGKAFFSTTDGSNCQDDADDLYFVININPSTALPTELISFDANTEGGKNHLTWRTASEKDNKHFDIERSTDGNSFLNIGQVKANNKPSSYQFVDNQPFATSYYRLRQIDFDETETLSKVISIATKSNNKLKAYPNPVSNILTVENTDLSRDYREGGNFQIINLLGQQVLTGKTAQRIDVSALPQGSYVLKMGTEQVKFMKQ